MYVLETERTISYFEIVQKEWKRSEKREVAHFNLSMGAPVHVLQAGDDVEDIVAIAAVAAVDAHGRGG